MKFKILSDSTCDLPKDILENNNVTLFPIAIMKDDQEYRDGVNIFPADIFAHVENGGALCSTSAGSVGEYVDFFAPYSKEYDGVLMISLGSGFSSTHQNALLAAEEFDNVRCVDSASLSSAQGLLVLKACELAKSCSSLDQLAAAVESYIAKIDCSFVLDQLKFLVKGGRCTAAAALGANLLNLKPCIELNDNKLTVGKKYRGSFSKSLPSYVKDRLSNVSEIDPDAMILVYTVDQPKELLDAVRETMAQCGITQAVEATAGCTISSHCGPGTLGLMFLRK